MILLHHDADPTDIRQRHTRRMAGGGGSRFCIASTTGAEGLTAGRSPPWTQIKVPMTKIAVTAGQMILDGFNIENLRKKRERRRSDAAGEIPCFVELKKPLPDCAGGCFMRTSSSCRVCSGPVGTRIGDSFFVR